MDIDKYGQKAVEKLMKAGKAILVFKVKKHADDPKFDTDSLAINLYVIPRSGSDSAPPENIPEEYFKGTISTTTDKDQRTFEVEVETLFGMFDRWWNSKPKREAKEMWIVAEPSDDCEKYYERTFYRRKLNAGPPIPLELSLKRRNDSDGNKDHMKETEKKSTGQHKFDL